MKDQTETGVGPCPSWCEDEPGHLYTEECAGEFNVITHLSRSHSRHIGTAWGQVWMSSHEDALTVAHSVDLWVIEQAAPDDPLSSSVHPPQVVVSEDVKGFDSAYGTQQMTVHQAEALADLVMIGVRACRAIEAGQEPVFP